MSNTKKTNFNMPLDLLDRLDQEAPFHHMNRTQYVIRACEQMLAADKYMRNAPEIQETMNKLISMLPQA